MSNIQSACLFFFIVLLSRPAYSQAEKNSNPNSPVFKNYRPPAVAPLLEQSDATYQLWQGFRVQQKANAGDAVSQFELSVRYLTGRGFKADTIKAAYWTKKAAEQNHLLARYNLGIFQFNGWGTEWNPFDAYRNFRFAAERNMPDAQYILAQFLTENLVVPKDWSEAYRWVKLAADSGYAPAKESLKEFERRGYHSQSDTTQVASTGDAQAASHSGTLQLPFLNFSPDTVKQAPDSILVDDVLKAAALSGMQGIEDIAGSITVRSGKLRIDSASTALIRQAAEGGSPEALTLLGRISEEARDIVQAATFYVRAIRLDSPGPAFFVQRRRGFRAREFIIFKLRSMRVETTGGAAFTVSNDERITRVGRVIRKYRIDEMPQILNILRGDMSWIGPRPEAIELSEWYAREIPYYIYRHAVRPGLTGWAQVTQGNVAEIDAATRKLHYDFYYIKNFSPFLDLMIAFKTVHAVLSGFGSR